MPTFTRFNSLSEQVAEKKIDFSSDTFKLLLSNTAPALTNTVKGDIAEIANGNGYTTGGLSVTINTSRTGAVTTITATDKVIQASGGAMAAWRYAVIYDDTAILDDLIGYVDRGSSITLAAGESSTLDFATNAILTIG